MRLDLIQQVLAMHEVDKACRAAFGCSAEELRERAQIGQALVHWGSAIKRFVYPCISPNGRTDGHLTYVRGDEKTGQLVCMFCGEPWRATANATDTKGTKSQ